MVVFVDLYDRAVEAFVLSANGVGVEEKREYGEKNRTEYCITITPSKEVDNGGIIASKEKEGNWIFQETLR